MGDVILDELRARKLVGDGAAPPDPPEADGGGDDDGDDHAEIECGGCGITFYVPEMWYLDKRRTVRSCCRPPSPHVEPPAPIDPPAATRVSDAPPSSGYAALYLVSGVLTIAAGWRLCGINVGLAALEIVIGAVVLWDGARRWRR